MSFAIRTPTPDLETSLTYYRRLGFTRLETESSGAWLSDGAVNIWIDPARHARTALVLFVDDPAAVAAGCSGPTLAMGDDVLCGDPNGVKVLLRRGSAPTPQGEPALTGRFAGLSIEAVDPAATVAFWQSLGFTVAAGGADQGWTQLARDGSCGISVMGMNMCPHLFPNPGLTYFNSGGNPALIARMRDVGVPLAEEITAFNDAGDVDNVILVDPGGTGFFVFND